MYKRQRSYRLMRNTLRVGRIIKRKNRIVAGATPVSYTHLIKSYQPDLVMNIALPYQDLTIMDACLACGVNYMDLSLIHI